MTACDVKKVRRVKNTVYVTVLGGNFRTDRIDCPGGGKNAQMLAHTLVKAPYTE